MSRFVIICFLWDIPMTLLEVSAFEDTRQTTICFLNRTIRDISAITPFAVCQRCGFQCCCNSFSGCNLMWHRHKVICTRLATCVRKTPFRLLLASDGNRWVEKLSDYRAKVRKSEQGITSSPWFEERKLKRKHLIFDSQKKKWHEHVFSQR